MLGFHPHCDHQGPTLTIAKTASDKVYGAFSSVSWDGSLASGTRVSDTQSFVFTCSKTESTKIETSRSDIEASTVPVVCGVTFGSELQGDCIEQEKIVELEVLAVL